MAITAASVSQVANPTRQRDSRGSRGRYLESQAMGERQSRSASPPRLSRSRAAKATMAPRTAIAPRIMAMVLVTVGAVMNRVSTSMRADNPGWAWTFKSVKMPPT